MELSRLESSVRDGAFILDVRPVGEFVVRHLAGAVFVALSRRRFPVVLRACVPPVSPLVVVAPTAALGEATRELIAGAGAYRILEILTLEGGHLEPEGWPTESLEAVTVSELERRLEAGTTDFTLVDVREGFEWNLGHVDGAVHVPLGELRARSATWSAGDEVICICEEGVRSVTGASLLRRGGRRAATTVTGGVAEWSSSGRPLKEA